MEGGAEVTGEKTRIYVGGLGAAVTEDDLRKTFSALGEVVAVDVVRTKGRSFAYLDFLPSSNKSLPKLFSTYNGCMWKGGKLRLEKAKEHYLLRLEREWQEESENAKKASDSRNTDPSESHDTLEKPKKPSPADKIQLNLFFPKLGKVKSLAQVGIGKHKYSFQRIQVPSIPTHFCDCEEHAPAFIPTNKRQSSEFENVSDGINEQELDIMNSVMNKIFERANPSKKVNGNSEHGREGSADSDNEFAAVEDDEEDNLIINVANGSDGMDLLGEMRTMMANREQERKRLITSSEKPKSVDDNREKTTMPLSKKRKSPHTELAEENNGINPVIPETLRNSKIRLDTREGNKTEGMNPVIPETSRNSKIRLDTREGKKTEGMNPAIPETSRNSKTRLDTRESKKTGESGKKQSGNNSLRSLKSTWKDLIGQKRNTPFNIADIIASIPQKKENLAKNANNTPEKKNSVSTEDDKNKESTTKVTEISIPDILPNDSHPKPEEPRADLDTSLPTTTRKTNESDVLPDACKQREDENINNQLGNSNDPSKNDEDLIRTARGESWRHKSSWTQLISTTSHTSFSISQIVPDISFEKQEQKADSFDSQPEKTNLNAFSAPINDQSSGGVVTVKKNGLEKKRSLYLGNIESDETCPFMRNDESMKEWKKAKASLSGSLNKKKRPVNESD